MEGKKKKRGLSFLEKNQDRTRSDPEPEQVGWLSLVRTTRCEVHCWPRKTRYDGYSGNGALLHHNPSKRELGWQEKCVFSYANSPISPRRRPPDPGFFKRFITPDDEEALVDGCRELVLVKKNQNARRKGIKRK